MYLIKFISALILSFSLSLQIIGQNIIKPDTCIDMKYYRSYCIVIKDTIRPSYCYYIALPNANYGKYNRSGMQFKGNTKHFNYAKSGYDKGHLVPAEDMTYSKEALESTFRWWNCVPQKVILNRGIWRKEEIKIHQIGKTKRLKIIVGTCNYENGIPKYCYKAVFDFSGKIISISIYNQNGKPVKVNRKFISTIKKIYLDCNKK